MFSLNTAIRHCYRNDTTNLFSNVEGSLLFYVHFTDLPFPKPVSEQGLDGDDMQKAIAASLEGQGQVPSMLGGQISREDQDISRLQQSYEFKREQS